jgi:putative spermidine/putrescine transport system substrate-binding protein
MMETSMSFDLRRRDLLVGGSKLALGTAALGVTGLAGAGIPAMAQETTLRVTHFGGPYQALTDIIAKPYEAASKTRVIYDVEISPGAMAKIQTQKSDPPFDVVMVSRAWGLRGLKGGLLAKVSPSDFPEASKLSPDIFPAEGWGVGTILDTIDLMVDTKQITAPVTSWMDLWRDDMKGKIMLPSAVNGATAFGFLACVVHAIGGDMKSEAAVNEAFARLKALKPDVRSFYADGAQPNMLMERGDIAVAPQFAIRIHNSSRAVPQIRKASPKEGVLAVPYDLCIPVNARNIAASKAYINFTLTKAIQEAMVSSLLVTPVRPDVAIPANIAPLINVDPKLLFFEDEEYAAIKQREWLDRYTREVQS